MHRNFTSISSNSEIARVIKLETWMEGNPGKHFVISSLPPIPQSTTNLYRCLQITHTIESRFSKVDWDPRLCSHHQHNFDEGPLLIAPDQIKRVVRQKLAQNDVYSFFYKLNQQEEVRYSNDVGNITTERGWSLTWTVKHNDIDFQTILQSESFSTDEWPFARSPLTWKYSFSNSMSRV